jgi:predicted RNA binding protein YcfA (HicA-like mRNA interferase family)
MPKLVPISGKNLLKLLLRSGFEILRIKGSHHFLMHKVINKTTTIPVHGNEDLGPGLLRQIMRDLDMSLDDFEELRTGK